MVFRVTSSAPFWWTKTDSFERPRKTFDPRFLVARGRICSKYMVSSFKRKKKPHAIIITGWVVIVDELWPAMSIKLLSGIEW